MTGCVPRNQLTQDLLHPDLGLPNVFPGSLSKKEAAVLSPARRRAEHSLLPPDHARVPSSLFLGRGSAASNPGFLGRGSVASDLALPGQEQCSLRLGLSAVSGHYVRLERDFNWPQFEHVKVPLADRPHAPTGL